MSASRVPLVVLFYTLSLFIACFQAQAQQATASAGNPIELEQMKVYEKIPFDRAKFEQVTNGMSEREVLRLLGKPADLKKEHRSRGRWTVHYTYPEGYVVNFKNGLVVGKEKR